MLANVAGSVGSTPKSIVAIKGSSEFIRDHRSEPHLTNAALYRRDRHICGYCGGHFREEFQTEEGEARRDDENFSYVAAWEFKGNGAKPELHKEPLVFDNVQQSVRSYK